MWSRPGWDRPDHVCGWNGTTGSRSDLANRGMDRVAELWKTGSDQAVFYGGNDIFGDTHVMYVLTASPENFALPARPQVPFSVPAWQKFAKPFGAIVISGAVVLSLAGLVNNWWQNRKKETAREGGKSLGQ